MELVTLHTHSTFCDHAKDSLADMVQAAVDAGVSVMAATEHYPISDSIDSTRYASMRMERLPEYIAAGRQQQELHPEIQLLLGCELDWLGPEEDRRIDFASLEEFDIILGSVHFIDRWLFNSSKFKERWEREDVDQLWRTYLERWCAAAASTWPFTVMAHPDVIKKFGFYPSFNLQPWYEDMAEAAAAGGRMVEVNTSGKFSPCAQYYPAPDLLKEFRAAGVPCTVGTDAHSCATIARDIREAYRYMAQAGYTQVTVPLPGGDRRTIPLL